MDILNENESIAEIPKLFRNFPVAFLALILETNLEPGFIIIAARIAVCHFLFVFTLLPLFSDESRLWRRLVKDCVTFSGHGNERKREFCVNKNIIERKLPNQYWVITGIFKVTQNFVLSLTVNYDNRKDFLV